MAWWNSHQAILLGPILLSVFGGDFSLLATSGMAISSLRSTRKLCLGGVFSLVRPLVWGFLSSYGGYAPWAFISVVALSTLMAWGQPVPRGRTTPTLLRFSVTRSSMMMCAMARCLISQNVFGQHLISESLKGPDSTPLVKAWTVMASSLVCSLTTYTLNLFKNSFNDSPWYCFTSNRS